MMMWPTLWSSCWNSFLILSTTKSAFMRAIMSLTFCLSAGFSASFFGRPCFSAHLISFCDLLSGFASALCPGAFLASDFLSDFLRAAALSPASFLTIALALALA